MKIMCLHETLICSTVESIGFEFFLFDKIVSILFGIKLL